LAARGFEGLHSELHGGRPNLIEIVLLAAALDDRAEVSHASRMKDNPSSRPKGLRQFLDLEQQAAWLVGRAELVDAAERLVSMEQRMKYAHRFQKLSGYPQAPALFRLLEIYGRTCLPIPRATERFYWSVSCLPSTSDKPLVRVSASWMELFTLYADKADLKARFIVHLSDITSDGSCLTDRPDRQFLAHCRASLAGWNPSSPQGGDIAVLKLAGAASIERFLTIQRALRSVRRFNLTHMNRGRNAYQASHSHSVADYMLGEADA